ncbi:transketolase [Natronosporangium hydrolyticum]|uniref:Transketolase n=1 Tax=Natronosporangium hydrolyticum TaxID=2811111 RepID=A0A895YD17_9ACTN|nr:transketolase [Natronosporangium hydrolyticum]QSB15677.1 transketolase [Natronosporangium hydrolyticum]
MTWTDLPPDQRANHLAELGQQLRVDAVRCAAEAGSGHPTSAMSAADLVAVLLGTQLRYAFDRPDDPHNDEFIISKGHASPLLYAALRAAGAITESELLTYRKLGSRLEGHPTPRLPWVKVATGSLGQGLPVGVGAALTAARLDRLPYRVWVLCGDSELAEGSMWEAFAHAGHERLANLTAIVDVNRLGQRGPTRLEWDTAAYARRISAFGWHTIEIDGHDVDQIDRAYQEATATTDAPTAILARTRKGKGAPQVEDQNGYHGKPLADAATVIAELGGARQVTVPVAGPVAEDQQPHTFPVRGQLSLPEYEVGESVPTRDAFGAALAALGDAYGDVVALDGEVSDSTRSGVFEASHPDRFFQFYIAEQQLVAAAIAMQARGWRPYLATFAAFLTRAYDFLRMAAISRANLRVVGSHAGVAIGEDGPSQMGLEDLAAFRAIHGSTVLHPCDANQTTALVRSMADRAGICYLRTSRGGTPVIYQPGEQFPIGGSRLLRSSPDDQVTIVGTGVTVHSALAAADQLAERGVNARVIDAYSVKPIDADALRTAARETARLLTVEDHWPEGGLGDAVLEVFADGGVDLPRIRKLAVRTMPGSAHPEQQLHAAGLDADSITRAAAELTLE